MSEREKIEYSELEGQLWYSYIEEEIVRVASGTSGHRTYYGKGVVPQEIIDQGQVAIKNFAQAQIDKKIKAEKAHYKKLDAYLKSLSHEVEIDYEDVLLRGKITGADGTVLTAELLEPYHARYSLTFGFASAISGHYIFNNEDPPYFSSYAIKSGEGMLIDVYKKEKHRLENKDVTDLVEKLNRGQRR